MKKFFAEFKKFITRGNVIDLAVGMIIGSAFTAIITAVVNSLLKPLIALIPLGKGGTFKTVLKTIYTLSDGTEYVTWGKNALGTAEALQVANDANATINEIALDWSAVIAAIITFIVTAFVLFLVIKAINVAKEAGAKGKEDVANKKTAKAIAKAEKKAGRELSEEEKFAIEKEVKAKYGIVVAEPETEPEPPKPTQEELLQAILDELKAKK